jgi:NADH dehydrogenase
MPPVAHVETTQGEAGGVLVTGATGFLGSYLCRELLARRAPFGIFVRSPERGRALVGDAASLQLGDVTDPTACDAAVRGHRAVVHLAAAADVSDPEVNRRVNVEGLTNVLQACRTHGVRRLLFVSSTCAGREHRDAYGETKLEGEALVREAGLEATILRPTMIYGRGSKEFEIFAGVVRHSPLVPLIGTGRNVIQPVFVGDAVQVMLEVLDNPTSIGQTYDLAGPAPIAFEDFVQAVARGCGRPRRRIVHVPPGPLLVAARLLGRVMTHVPLTVDQVMAFIQNTRVDLEPLKRDLGFTPLPLEVGLGRVLGPETGVAP